MLKTPTRRILIAQAAEASSLSKSTLRRLDRRGLVVPRRDLRGNRVYSAADVQRLRVLAGLDDQLGDGPEAA